MSGENGTMSHISGFFLKASLIVIKDVTVVGYYLLISMHYKLKKDDIKKIDQRRP